MAKKVLIIDDEPDLLVLVTHGLSKKGYEVFSGQDGREALALTAQLMPDLIILDACLPMINGYEIARMFKNDEKLKHIPIFLISSVTEDLRRRTEESGAEAYLTKPFKLDELVSLANRYCEPDPPQADA